MRKFLTSLFGKGKAAGNPSGTPAPGAASMDVDGMIFQASTRVPVDQLLKSGRKDIHVLSRDRIEQLIHRSLQSILGRYTLVDASAAAVSRAQLDAETRQEFNELLSQYLRSTLDANPSPELPIERVGHRDSREKTLEGMALELGRGLQIGTLSLTAAAIERGMKDAVYRTARNVFLDIPVDPQSREVLGRFGIEFVAQGDKGYIVGDTALEMSRLFGRQLHRPLTRGTLAPGEPVALFILSLLIQQLLGTAQEKGEVCVYSVPSDPLEGDRELIYHRGALDTALRTLGYTPRAMEESHLIICSELKDQEYSGVGISCGAGMFNIGLSHMGVPAVGFSTGRGGDWVDESAATALGLPLEQVREVKEGGMDLLDPQGRVEGAIAIYTRHLLQYTVELMRQNLGDGQRVPSFRGSVPIVCAGGACRIAGFLEMFREEVEKVRFPLKVDFIRLARDPLHAVAAGCLQAAQEEMRAMKDPGPAGPASLERAAVKETQREELPSLKRFRGTHVA